MINSLLALSIGSLVGLINNNNKTLFGMLAGASICLLMALLIL